MLLGQDTQEKRLRTEMAYYANSHKADKIARRQLFRINGITYEEMLENLCVLLDDEISPETSAIANLTTNKDALQILKDVVSAPEKPQEEFYKPNKMFVVMWQNCDSKYEWYLAYLKRIENDGTFIMDHLKRAITTSHSKWKYPSKEDIQHVEEDQILKIKVKGEWDITPDSRKHLFNLSNVKDICGEFNKFTAKQA